MLFDIVDILSKEILTFKQSDSPIQPCLIADDQYHECEFCFVKSEGKVNIFISRVVIRVPYLYHSKQDKISYTIAFYNSLIKKCAEKNAILCIEKTQVNAFLKLISYSAQPSLVQCEDYNSELYYEFVPDSVKKVSV